MAFMMPVDLDLTISQGPSGKYSYTWSQGSYNDANGNLDLTKIRSDVLVTIRVKSDTLKVSFDPQADQDILLDPSNTLAPNACPTTPAAKLPAGAPFQGFTTPGSDPTVIQFVDTNNDHTTWSYGLKVIVTDSAGTAHEVLVDPKIINN